MRPKQVTSEFWRRSLHERTPFDGANGDTWCLLPEFAAPTALPGCDRLSRLGEIPKDLDAQLPDSIHFCSDRARRGHERSQSRVQAFERIDDARRRAHGPEVLDQLRQP